MKSVGLLTEDSLSNITLRNPEVLNLKRVRREVEKKCLRKTTKNH